MATSLWEIFENTISNLDFQTAQKATAIRYYRSAANCSVDINYCELLHRIDHLANFLMGFQHSTFLVAICIDFSPSLVTSILSIWKLKFAYIPIPTLNSNRNKSLLETIFRKNDFEYIIANQQDLDEDKELQEMIQIYNCKCICINEMTGKVSGVYNFDRKQSGQQEVTENNQHLAYIIFSSGTTGEPKFISVPHRCIIPNIQEIAERFQITHQDVFLLSSPPSFDPSLVQIFATLIRAACLLIVSRNLLFDSEVLCRKIFLESKLSIIQPTPSYFEKVIHSSDFRFFLKNDECKFRVLAFGGESFPNPKRFFEKYFSEDKQDNQMQQLLKNVNTSRWQFWNLYGTTEVSIWATIYKLDSNDIFKLGQNVVPLGSALSGTYLAVLSEDGQDEGELWIGGKALERTCYLESDIRKMSLKNGEDFVMRPSGDIVKIECGTGKLFFVERKNNIIKVLGKQIVPQVIVNHILDANLEGIINLFVISHFSSFYQRQVLSLVVISNNSKNEGLQQSIGKVLHEKLPSYHHPDEIFFCSEKEIEVTAHGKINTKKLIEFVNLKQNKLLESSRSSNAKPTKEQILDHLIEIVQTLISNSLFAFDYSRTRIEPSLSHQQRQDMSQIMLVSLGVTSIDAFRLQEHIQFFLASHGVQNPYRFAETIFSLILHETLDNISSHLCNLIQQNAKENFVEMEPKNEDNSLAQFVSTASASKKQKVSKIDDFEWYIARCNTFGERQSKALPSLRSRCQTLSTVKNATIEWKFNVKKCVDSSPLLLGFHDEVFVITASHAGIFSCISFENPSFQLWEIVLLDRIERYTTIMVYALFF